MRKIFIILFFVLSFLSSVCNADNKDVLQTGNCCSIAYIDIEKLYRQYNRISGFSEKIRLQEEEDLVSLDNKKASLEEAIKEFQQKIENNSFLSADHATKEYEKLTQRESDLESLSKKKQQERKELRENEKNQVRELIKEATEKYNQTAKFQFILTKNGIDNIIIANSEYDITEDVLFILNTEYAAEKENNRINNK